MNKNKFYISLLLICLGTQTIFANSPKKYYSVVKVMGSTPHKLLGTGVIDASCKTLPSVAALNRVLQQKALTAVPLNFNTAAFPLEFIASPRNGVETLRNLAPAWKTRMRPLFTEEQLELVTLALGNTDKLLFREDASSLTLVNHEWDYASHFARELVMLAEEKGILFSNKQYKYLLGGRGAPENGLWMALHLMSLEGWLLHSNYTFPRQTYWKDGKQVPAAELSEEELTQRLLAKKVDFLIRTGNPANPIISRLIYLRESTRVNALVRTPKEWLEELEKWLENHEGAFPKGSFLKDGVIIPHEELTPAQLEEVRLASGIDRTLSMGDPADPVIIRIKELRDSGRVYSKRRTPQEWLVLLEEFVSRTGRLPRGSFSVDGKNLKAAELSPAQLDERNLSSALRHYISKGDPQDPTIARMIEIRDTYSTRK